MMNRFGRRALRGLTLIALSAAGLLANGCGTNDWLGYREGQTLAEKTKGTVLSEPRARSSWNTDGIGSNKA